MPQVSSADSIHQFSYLPKVVNGGLAGIVGITCVFPLDLVKTRLQNQIVSAMGSAQYKGILDCAHQTWRSGGSTFFFRVRSMYPGSGVNILLITPEKAVKLVANDFFRHKLAKAGEKKLSITRGVIAGICIALCHIVITCPMELLKIQLQQASGTKVSATKLALELFKQKGIAGLYKGLWPTVVRDVPFSIIYFPLFATLDSLGPRKSNGSGDAVFYTSFISGIIAGAIAAFSVTPFDVVKTRCQLIKKSGGADIPHYKGVGDAFAKILRNEGLKALFKGAACRVIVIAPLFGIAQMIYYVGIGEWLLGIQKDKHV